MDIKKLYQDYKTAESARIDGNRPREEIKEKRMAYNNAREKLFEALKIEYEAGNLASGRADEAMERIKYETEHPYEYWGSEKIGMANRKMFVADMEFRLFEALLESLLEQIGGAEQC